MTNHDCLLTDGSHAPALPDQDLCEPCLVGTFRDRIADDLDRASDLEADDVTADTLTFRLDPGRIEVTIRYVRD